MADAHVADAGLPPDLLPLGFAACHVQPIVRLFEIAMCSQVVENLCLQAVLCLSRDCEQYIVSLASLASR